MRNLKRAVRESAQECLAGLVMREVAVQRLVIVLPAVEQPAEVMDGLKDFPPMPRERERETAQAEDEPAGGEKVDGGAPSSFRPAAVQPRLALEGDEIQDIPRPPRAVGRRGQPRKN